jgi:predicted nuclease of predicted toxin-antitoxin system
MGDWRFFLDENVDPKTATYLQKEGLDTEHVRDSLYLGADDQADILPYVRETDRILVTSDVTDFVGLAPADHAGLVLLCDDSLPAYDVASALISMTDAYGDRSAFSGREELDAWL